MYLIPICFIVYTVVLHVMYVEMYSASIIPVISLADTTLHVCKYFCSSN